jgi:hypothetical protein
MGKKKQLPGRQLSAKVSRDKKIKPIEEARFRKHIVDRTESRYAQSAAESRKRISDRCKGTKYEN